MAQPPGDVRTDNVRTDNGRTDTSKAGADAPPNPLYVQISDDFKQQFRTFDKNAGGANATAGTADAPPLTSKSDSTSTSTSTKVPALPGLSLFEQKRNDIPADTTLPAHDFTKDRQLMFRGMSTIKCHGGNSSTESSSFNRDYKSLESFFQKSGKSPLLDEKPKADTPHKTALTDEQYKQLVEWLKDANKQVAKPTTDGKPAQQLSEAKVEFKEKDPNEKQSKKVEQREEAKAQPTQEIAPAQTQENKQEEKKKEEKKPEVPKVEEIPLTAFEQSIKNSGAYTVENVSAAYAAAGKDKSGVALLIVGENTPGSKELLEKLPQLQAQHPDLKFVVVNKDKLNERLEKNPADDQAKTWKAWVEQNLKDCHGQPINYSFTSVQSLKADANGKPVPEKVTSTHWGANIETALADQSRYAAAGTARNAGDFKIETKPEAPSKAEESIKPISVFRPKNPAEAVAFIQATKPQFHVQETTVDGQNDRQEKYLQAIAVADKVNPEYLRKQKIAINLEIEKENSAMKTEDYERSPSDLPYDKTKLEALNKNLQDLDYLEKAPSLLRAAMGVDLLKQAANEENPEKKKASQELAQDILLNAIKADPKLAKDDDFDFQLFNLKVDTAKLAQEADASIQISADQINQKLNLIRGIRGNRARR
ncbi:hypothetical protein BH11CYA1_BH11CYA1_00550 [soil metagenome]